jgi:hypothetical protein
MLVPMGTAVLAKLLKLAFILWRQGCVLGVLRSRGGRLLVHVALYIAM